MRAGLLGIGTGRGRRRLLRALPLVVCLGVATQMPAQGRTQVPADAIATSGGIVVESRGVLFGQARRSKKPAELDFATAVRATPEFQKISSDGVRPGTARYLKLMQSADRRVKKALRKVAREEGRDCVVKKGSILRNPDDLEVVDLTAAVVAKVQS